MSLDFVALDVETANHMRGSICSFGLTFVEDGQIVETVNWLNQPPEAISGFDQFNIDLHGITPEMVKDEPTFLDRLQQVMDVINGRPIVCHYAPFDTGAIRDACDFEWVDGWPPLTYGCTVALSRRSLNLLSYRLPFVCEELGIPLNDHHQAGADAEACARIALELARRQDADSLEDLAAGLSVRLGRIDPHDWHGCVRTWPGGSFYGDTPTANVDADPGHPLYGQVIVFTGALSLRREDAWAAVANLGATPEKNVTKRTTMLVVGDGFTGNSLTEFGTGKAVKALAWQAKGHTIEVIGESDLFALLDDQVSGSRQDDPVRDLWRMGNEARLAQSTQ